MKKLYPAFPQTGANPPFGDCDEGMSLRDYFAAAALHGMTAGITRFCDDEPAKSAGIIVNRPRDVAEIAYTYADCMIAERKKNGAV